MSVIITLRQRFCVFVRGHNLDISSTSKWKTSSSHHAKKVNELLLCL